MSVSAVKNLLKGRLKEEFLIKEKERDYKRLLLIMTIYGAYLLIALPLIKIFKWQEAQQLYSIGYLLLSLTLLYMIFDMTRNFTSNRLFLVVTFLCLMSGVVLGVMGGTMIRSNQQDLYCTLMTVSFATSIYGSGMILYFMIRDIFAEAHKISYRLWGAAVIYGLFSMFFTSVLALIQLYIPDALGFLPDPGMDAYHSCFRFSFYILSNFDNPYPNAIDLFKNIGAVQGFFSSLYVVLVVGRLLSR